MPDLTIRFFILQTHYRSTLDFGNEALLAAEKGLKRLWEAYSKLSNIVYKENKNAFDKTLDDKIQKLINELTDFMNDDFNTAKVLANLFDIVPIINSMYDQTIPAAALSKKTFDFLQKNMKEWMENILGLTSFSDEDNDKLQGVMQLLIDIRKEAKSKKDFVTSDKIRNKLQELGITLKDEKGGDMSWQIE